MRKGPVWTRVFVLLLVITIPVLFVLINLDGESEARHIIPGNDATSAIRFAGGSYLSLGPTIFSIDVARSSGDRAQGLSGVESMPKDAGLLFMMGSTGHHSFWMKDMNFPIDIIWFNDDLEVVDITENISPDSYPEVFKPAVPARYVLEINAGLAKLYGITIGEEALLRR